jgi:hypothetical protein
VVEVTVCSIVACFISVLLLAGEWELKISLWIHLQFVCHDDDDVVHFTFQHNGQFIATSYVHNV